MEPDPEFVFPIEAVAQFFIGLATAMVAMDDAPLEERTSNLLLGAVHHFVRKPHPDSIGIVVHNVEQLSILEALLRSSVQQVQEAN